MKLFVKNIDKEINEVQLEGLFALYGKVLSCRIVYDKITWESKGFGFIEMVKNEEAQKAMTVLNGKELRGKALIIEEAIERR